MTARCYIFGALSVSRLCETPAEGDLVIAADKGYDVAMALGITPDLVVGDFDSRGQAPEGENVVRLNVRKDDTDTEHAVKIALGKGCTDFVIYGAAGGGLDHTLGNIAVAEMIAKSGGRAVFYGEESSFTVIRDGSVRLPQNSGGRVSVFSLTEISRGVSIKGLSYEVQDIDLPRATTLGVSNAFVGKEAEIGVSDGTLLIVWESF